MFPFSRASHVGVTIFLTHSHMTHETLPCNAADCARLQNMHRSSTSLSLLSLDLLGLALGEAVANGRKRAENENEKQPNGAPRKDFDIFCGVCRHVLLDQTFEIFADWSTKWSLFHQETFRLGSFSILLCDTRGWTDFLQTSDSLQ